jgi:hypothetical protein
MNVAPRECIGKFVSFDCDHGALWAHIVDVIQFNSVNGPREAFVADGMVVRHHGAIQVFHERRVVHIDNLELKNIVSTDDLRKGGEEDEEMFLKLLAADELEGSSLGLASRLRQGGDGRRSEKDERFDDEEDNINFLPGMGPKGPVGPRSRR